MNLPKILMQYADENELHDIDNNGVCRCDICQKLIPAAINGEKSRRKMALALIDIHNGLPEGSEESLRLKIEDIEENGHPELESEDTLDILMELYSDTLATVWYILNKFDYNELEAVTENQLHGLD